MHLLKCKVRVKYYSHKQMQAIGDIVKFEGILGSREIFRYSLHARLILYTWNWSDRLVTPNENGRT